MSLDDDTDAALREKLAVLKAAAPEPRADLMSAARASVDGRRRSATPWIALAAGIGGLFVGLAVSQPLRPAAPMAVGPEMTARGALAAALNATPSGRTARGWGYAATPLYTVIAQDGRVCRTYRAEQGRAAYEAVACRDGRTWRILALAGAPRPAGGFAQASGDEPAAVAAAIDGLDAGDPLDARAERALIARRWRRE